MDVSQDAQNPWVHLGPHVGRTRNPRWILVEEGFNLAREHEIESLFAASNGYVGSRASLAEGSSLSAPATFIAGVYDIPPDSPGSVPELAAAPDWMQISASLEGMPIALSHDGALETLEHRRILDMRQGIFWREWSFRDPQGRLTRISGMRLVSLADRHLLFQSVLLCPLNYSASIELRSHIAPPAKLPGRLELQPESAADSPQLPPATAALSLYTGTGVRIGMAAKGRVCEDVTGDPKLYDDSPETGVRHIHVQAGKAYRLDRLVAVYTSNDAQDPIGAAVAHVARCCSETPVRELLDAHVTAWQRLWETSDVTIEGDDDAQRAIRFACYHLLAAANPDDERTSVSARALTGPAYKGHVFWDTEIFMLPFYIFTQPAAARTLLTYRYRTLDGARRKARRLGYRGALFAWESADTGDETTPPYVMSPEGEMVRIWARDHEQHISADVAYGVWQYWQATGDDRFFRNVGAEILLETARFWASRVEEDSDGSLHIRHVVGPDEYHDNVDDNVFTNIMAQWNLEAGAEAVSRLAEYWPQRWRELAQRLELTAEETGRWRETARRIHTGTVDTGGVMEQFAGYFSLEEIDLTPYGDLRAPVDVLLGRERIQRSQVIKQADVVMLVYLLWDRFDDRTRRANFRYYEPRSGHGSSLSPAIHALVAARLGEMSTAMAYFRQASEIDLSDNMGNAAHGVHAAALGGLWQAVVFGFAGMSMGADGLAFAPRIPESWRALRVPLQWRGQQLRVEADAERFSIRHEGSEAVAIAVGDGPRRKLAPGTSVRWQCDTHGNWREVTP